MNRLLPIALLAAAVVAVFALLTDRSPADATVLFTCDHESKGELIFSDAGSGQATSHSLTTLCKDGTLTIPAPRPGQSITVRLAGEPESALELRDGEEIDRTTDGIIILLDIRNRAPRLRPGRI